MALIVELLNKSHDRKGFTCGSEPLDGFLKRDANQNQKSNVSRTHVLVDDSDQTAILGFYSLSAASVANTEISLKEAKKLPRYPIPATRLGRLAISKDQQSNGYGSLLLIDAIRRSVRASADVGIYLIVVDAKDDQAKAFYQRYGFLQSSPDAMQLYLPLSSFTDI